MMLTERELTIGLLMYAVGKVIGYLWGRLGRR